MMTVSSVSRKTTRKTGTEKTSLAIAGDEQSLLAAQEQQLLGTKRRPHKRKSEKKKEVKKCKGES